MKTRPRAARPIARTPGHFRLAAAQQQTEQNLNTLIKIVDDLIRRNGRPS